VVMRHEDLRPATKRAAQSSTTKLKKRLSRGEKSNRKRMAQVAAVYTVDRFVRTAEDVVGDLDSVGDSNAPPRKQKRPKPEHKRVWASVEKDPGEVISEMMAEGLRRDPKRRKQWVALVDGSEHQLSLLHAALQRNKTKATIEIGRAHV